MWKVGTDVPSLADFNIHHFKPDGPDLQAILPNYEEYRAIVRENQLSDELIPRSLYFQHQRIVHQIMQSPDMDRLLITHEAGTGKTGTYLGVAQYAKHQWIRHAGDRLNQPIIRKTLFLPSGSPQANDIRRMLVCIFGGSEYLVHGKSITSQRILIDGLIKKWYEIVPYRIFTARMLTEAKKSGLTTKEYIRRKYSGYLIIIDEFHNLRIGTDELRSILDAIEDEDYQGLELADDLNEADLAYDDGVDSKNTGKMATRSGISKSMVIELILNLADFAPNVKIMIGSATLIVKNRDDLKTPMMAILKGEKRREFLEMDLFEPPDEEVEDYINDDSNLTDEEIDILSNEDDNSVTYDKVMREVRDRVLERILHPYFVNRVSHVQALVGKWKKITVGDKIDIAVGEYGTITDDDEDDDDEEERTIKQSITVYPVYMTGEQEIIYRRVYQRSTTGTGKSRIRDIYTSARQASIFVYPDGKSGNDSFKKYINVSKEKGFGYELGPELDSLFTMDRDEDIEESWENLQERSAIYYDICQKLNDNETFKQKITRIESNPDSAKYGQSITEYRNIGVIAIYIPYMDGPGIILLGLLLERFCGMERFKASGRIIGHREAGEEGDMEVFDYCPSPVSSIVNLTKTSRYAIIHSSTSLSILDNAKNVLKSNDNVNGDYIRVALIPQEGREGVSINSASAFIRVGSDWNPAENYQAEKRVFRENSSDFIINYIMSTGNEDLIRNYLDNGAMKIRVYDMVAVTLDDDNMIEWNNSIGAKIHGSIIRQDVMNAPIRRMIKRFAIDCHLNHRRNTLPAELEGTAECDYRECDYGCYNHLEDTGVITTNYNNMFYDSGSDTIANIIIQFFQSHKETSITYLIRYVEQVLGLSGEVYIPILRSLEDLIRRQVEFTNQYGYSTHIINSKGRVFVSNGNVNNSYYIENLHGQKSAVSNTVENIRYRLRAEVLEEFIRLAEDRIGNRWRHVIPDINWDTDEEKQFVKSIREILYNQREVALILEAALQEKFSNRYEYDYYVECILYVTRNHWVRVPYPDRAIDLIRRHGTTSTYQGRKISREVPIKYVFKPSDDIFSGNRRNYIIHDLAMWSPSTTITTFYNADSPLRVAKINGTGRWRWSEYKIDGTKLIQYHAFREAFKRERTQRLFDDNNDMIIPETDQTTPIYGIILGSKDIAIVDHIPTSARKSSRITSATSKILPYKKTEEGLNILYSYIYREPPTKRQLDEFKVNTNNVINDVRYTIRENNHIVYL